MLTEEIDSAKAEGKIDIVTLIVAHVGFGCLVGATVTSNCKARAVGEATEMLQNAAI
ncbi:hypothetical protein O9A_00918 [Bartonella koehlerae C-29]|uniref:Uncharacterized protein n=2 Tax=Bartonella koehlerae TaxID=92181 RepID=A0A067WE25_9HYPH|nr:hypothetical protein O9A_00918 [Bartonella koehlerae C-29]